MTLTSMRLALVGRLAVAAAVAAATAATLPAQQTVEVIRAVGGLPAHVAASFSDAISFQRPASGNAYVFDRASHTVYRISPDNQRAEPIVQIGQEPGRIYRPGAFDMADNGTFVVADAPNRRERIQVFTDEGVRLGGFTLPGRTSPRVSVAGFILNGVSSLDYTGRSILINQPERDTLITEYGLAGTPLRTFGMLRTTGFEDNRNVHLALNTGIPLALPRGGFYFVFQAGRPLFRKYDAEGRLLFERHIEGPEVDPTINTLPNAWPLTLVDDERLPIVAPSIRTAAVDSAGRLWVGLTRPYVYVYDQAGEKIRTLQLDGAGVLTVTSFSFSTDGRVLVTPGCYEFEVP